MIDIPNNLLPQNDNGETICPKCTNNVDACTCPVMEEPQTKQEVLIPIVRLDKKERRGKVVTMITNLAPNLNNLKLLAKKLKSQTGSGGTFYIKNGTGIIEIQGDHIQKIQSISSELLKE